MADLKDNSNPSAPGNSSSSNNSGGLNGLSSLAGHLGRAFRGQRLDTLQKLFLAAAVPENRVAAASALTQFHQAAGRLRASESAFTRRARPKSDTPTLLKHLRTPAQYAAVRSFAAARQALLVINPEIGRRIVRLTTADDIATHSAAHKPAAPKSAAAAFRPL